MLGVQGACLAALVLGRQRREIPSLHLIASQLNPFYIFHLCELLVLPDRIGVKIPVPIILLRLQLPPLRAQPGTKGDMMPSDIILRVILRMNNNLGWHLLNAVLCFWCGLLEPLDIPSFLMQSEFAEKQIMFLTS